MRPLPIPLPRREVQVCGGHQDQSEPGGGDLKGPSHFPSKSELALVTSIYIELCGNARYASAARW